jgi:hypothetical protein
MKQRILVALALLVMAPIATARFVSTDPVKPETTTGENFNRYHYAAGNPYRYIDPDGREIRVANAADRPRIERMINSTAVGVYRFNRQGVLQQVRSSGDSSRYSSYYSSRLNAAIASDKVVNVGIGQTYTNPFTGEAREVHGGLTQALGPGLSDQNVMITGESYTGDMLTSTGDPLTQSPAMILMHEMVGHAIPGAVGSDTGNAVSNENKVRIEIPNADIRMRDEHHIE